MSELAEAVVWSLTGERLDAETVVLMEAETPASIVMVLADGGWDAARIIESRDRVRAAGGVWPHPVPPELLAAAGPARVLASVRAVRRLLEPPTRPVRRPSELDAGDRRLIEQLPPHHGRVG